jgi:ribonuclease P protein subunit RPR2
LTDLKKHEKVPSVNTREIAEERIRILFEQAEDKLGEEPVLSKRYLELARRIGERAQVSIPEELRRKFCSNCNLYFKPGNNCKVSFNTEEKFVEYTCGECGEVEKYGYKE